MGARLELAAIIPVLNQLEVTGRCLDLLAQHAMGDLQIVLVDNGSDPPVVQGLPLSDLGMPTLVVRRERNLGVVESLLAGCGPFLRREAVEAVGIAEAPGGWERLMYRLGERRWRHKWGSRVPVVVEPDHTVHRLHGRSWWDWQTGARR